MMMKLEHVFDHLGQDHYLIIDGSIHEVFATFGPQGNMHMGTPIDWGIVELFVCGCVFVP